MPFLGFAAAARVELGPESTSIGAESPGCDTWVSGSGDGVGVFEIFFLRRAGGNGGGGAIKDARIDARVRGGDGGGAGAGAGDGDGGRSMVTPGGGVGGTGAGEVVASISLNGVGGGGGDGGFSSAASAGALRAAMTGVELSAHGDGGTPRAWTAG